MSDVGVSCPIAVPSLRRANHSAQTNGVTVVDDAAATKAQQKVDDLQRATEAGWQKPIPFEYEAAGSEAGPDDERDNVKWLSDAVVYEWIDEYGEVGPRDKDLEKQLYEDPDIQRRGGDAGMKNLSFEVLIQPFRDVSKSCQLSRLPLTVITVRRRWLASCHS
jgi:hypothetical protein